MAVKFQGGKAVRSGYNLMDPAEEAAYEADRKRAVTELETLFRNWLIKQRSQFGSLQSPGVIAQGRDAINRIK
jgi:hypothetical protein